MAKRLKAAHNRVGASSSLRQYALFIVLLLEQLGRLL